MKTNDALIAFAAHVTKSTLVTLDRTQHTVSQTLIPTYSPSEWLEEFVA
jgi:hypothetical protein